MVAKLAIIIPSIVSIIGFIVTVIAVRSQCRNNMALQQSQYMCQRLSDIMEVLKKFLSGILSDDEAAISEQLDIMKNRIEHFGSLASIKIIYKIMVETRKWDMNKRGSYNYFLIANIALLMSQIKYDITGVMVNPFYWLKIETSDYEGENKLIVDQSINESVDELNLLKKFKIKCIYRII